jgi:hypothetical protein
MADLISVEWLDTPEMARRFGIHPKTLLKLRAAYFSPFREGEHYRRRGLTTRAPLHWHPVRAEEAFTGFKRVDPSSVEAFSREIG